MLATPDEILAFWFEELGTEAWFRQSDEIDQICTDRFAATWEAASKAECAHWRADIHGRLAEVIVLDQFPRNMFRDSARAFSTDALALTLSQEALKAPDIDELSSERKAFLLMPFMHSESPVIHEDAVKLFAEPGLENNLEFELSHKAIIDRFGRYPHRNAVLGRASTAEEIEYLEGGGETFS